MVTECTIPRSRRENKRQQHSHPPKPTTSFSSKLIPKPILLYLKELKAKTSKSSWILTSEKSIHLYSQCLPDQPASTFFQRTSFGSNGSRMAFRHQSYRHTNAIPTFFLFSDIPYYLNLTFFKY